MIREFKVDSKKDKSLVRADARKKHIKNRHNQAKQGKPGKPGGKDSKKTKKNIQKGGNSTKSKDKFEVTTLDNVDPSKFSVSQYVNANIDWGLMPGPPPTDCCIS